MMCVYKGKLCVLKFRIDTGRWVYIRERDWIAMSQMERDRYVDSEYEARLMEGEA